MHQPVYYIIDPKGRSGPSAAATSKMERFVQPLHIAKPFILDVAAALDPPLKGTPPYNT